jgi:FMN phosphatase YigB (HAD superfamily)
MSAHAILFSLDVLTKTKTERETLELNVPLPTETLCPLLLQKMNMFEVQKVGQTIVVVFNALVDQMIYNDFRPPNLAAVVERALRTVLKREPLYDEVNELIALVTSNIELKVPMINRAYIRALYNSGHILGVVANMPIPGNLLMDILAKSELKGFFETIITSNDMGAFKPSQDLYRYAIESMHCQPKDVVIVGSNLERDIEPLHDIHSRKVFLTKRAKVKLPKAVQHIASLSELRAIL